MSSQTGRNRRNKRAYTSFSRIFVLNKKCPLGIFCLPGKYNGILHVMHTKIYYWIAVFLTAICVPLGVAFSKIHSGLSYGTTSALSSLTSSSALLVTGACVLFILLAGAFARFSITHTKVIKWPGYLLVGIFTVCILLLAQTQSCVGLFCGMSAAIFLFLLAPVLFLLVIFQYFVYLCKKPDSITRAVGVELLIVLLLSVTLFQQLQLDSSLAAFSASKTVDPAAASKVCNSFPASDGRGFYCWETVISKNPGQNVCLFAVEEKKEYCLISMRNVYERNGCEQTYLDVSRNEDPAGYAQADKCWATAAKIYPGLKVCELPGMDMPHRGPWDAARCLSFLKTLGQ